ncbi:hypothetical protein [Lacticaseibacillus mingshuiensis]|uniref:PepSY domain-containing protein n=1 Tax=Lacticaseibacillus mingshuiensis TaxID=2799574 RepID=A0ABW4CIA8_9LACO|nr:hypothetical protein [Lacticaseibacillus mingshuiensis]
MRKNQWLLIGALAPLAAGVIAESARRYYWHHLLPNRLFKEMKQDVATTHTVTGGWIEMAPVDHADGTIWQAAYQGGVTTEDGAVINFTVSATGQRLDQ